MLDRIFDNWCNESGLLLERASVAEIDSVATDYVHAGPFFVLNLAHGNPIIVETNTLQADEEGEHYRPASIFRSVERWATVAPMTICGGGTCAAAAASVSDVATSAAASARAVHGGRMEPSSVHPTTSSSTARPQAISR